jgi:Holliday junction resolvasome RuvABC endonuclease subunit
MNGIPLFTIPTLAADPALLTGWSFGRGEEFEHGVWSLKGGASEHAGAPLVRLEKHLVAAHERFGFERLVFEAAAYGSKHPATRQFHDCVRGVLIATAYKLDVAWAEYSPATIKAYAGHGHYKKPQMIAALERHFGIKVRSEDECDAIWILLLDQHRRSSPLAQAAPKPKAKSCGRRKPKDPTLF